ncbi:MAG: hypothetical protein LJE69_00105, partial [Thiohalocapsa sp.]|uniref:hypothetical protein n=1 Tax=Thiohalocapsa sp. TaxID=2497641 RepID=UPI0025EE3AA6
GIPYVSDGMATWSPPSFLPRDQASGGILFFDELNAAPPLVQASLYQLTLDRRVGEYELPPGWRIVAAGNRAEDASVVYRMPAALANRFVHLDFEVDVDDWVAWAMEVQIHPLVIAFIRARRELLLDMKNLERAFPTPRAWEMLSDVVNRMGSPKEAADTLIGVVGEGAALEFIGFCERSLTEQAMLKILKRPEKAKLPTGVGELYALISYVSARAKDDAVLDSAARLLARLSPELAVLLIGDILRVNPALTRKPGYLDFIRQHGDPLV